MRSLTTGIAATVITDRGNEIEIKYAIVELSKLVASHDIALRVNRTFPKKLQPRDRARIASADQVNRIVQNLRPELLGVSVKASDGAPIIGPDAVVESGNARTVALMRAYAGELAKPYRAFLIREAKGLGLEAKKIRAAKQPILVRIRKTAVDREAFVRECNEQSVAAMSYFEQAREDAGKLDAGILSTFMPDEDGNIMTAANQQFVKLFVARVIAPTQIGMYVDRAGSLAQAGVHRIQNALLAKAYGDFEIIERIAEATDFNVRKIATAMLKKSAHFATLKENIATGSRHRFDISEDLTIALRKLSWLRDQNRLVADYLKEQALFADDALTPLQRRILEAFDAHKLSGRILEDILQSFIDQVETFGHPSQAQIFATPLPTIAEVFDQAVMNATDVERRKARMMKRKKKVSGAATWDRAAAARKAWLGGKLLAKKLASQKRKAA